MKVDVLSSVSRNAGGLFYSVRWLSQALLQRQVDIRMLSPVDEFAAEDRPVWDPVDVALYNASGPLQTSRQLRGMLRNSPADLVHVHGIWLDSQWAAHQWHKRTGKPVVVSPRGMLDPWALRNSAWKKKVAGALFANAALREASCIHALCRSEVESIRAYGLKTPVALIPNGMVLPEIQFAESKSPAERKKLLFLGRIHPKKGLKELLAAWGKAQSLKPDTLSNWKLVIAGWDDGGHEQSIKTLVAELGLDASVSFAGPQFGEEKARLLRSADAFVLPSFSEGLPMSVLEAWAYGLPVVMTDFCNLPEGFGAAAAVRVEPNPDSVLQGLEQLAAMTDDEMKAMGANGRKLVEQKFTWTRIAEQMQQVYQWCLTGTNAPACMEF